MHKQSPAYKSMLHYFSRSNAPKFRGRPRTNLPRKLDQDLERFYGGTLRLKSLNDLQTLEMIAQDRREWKNLVSGLCVAAKADKGI